MPKPEADEESDVYVSSVERQSERIFDCDNDLSLPKLNLGNRSSSISAECLLSAGLPVNRSLKCSSTLMSTLLSGKSSSTVPKHRCKGLVITCPGAGSPSLMQVLKLERAHLASIFP